MANTLVGNIKGPQGPAGAPGADSTVPGPPGAQGTPGATGSQGPAGSTGVRGSQWYSGTTAPPDPIPGSLPGDQYLNTVTGDVYTVS